MKISENGCVAYRLCAADGRGEATVVPALGAVVSSLRLPGAAGLREVLYQHPHFWDPAVERTRGGIPFLFPVCGRLERGGATGTYLLDGRLHDLKIHGFAMRAPWQVVKSDDVSLTARLVDTEHSRAAFPFRFRVTLTFRFEAGAFLIDQAYENTGTRPMPYYAGFHPFFATPAPGQGKEATRLDFRPVSRWVYNGTLSDICRVDDPPTLPRSVTDPAINEMLARVDTDREVRLLHPDGLVVHTRADGVEDDGMFPFVQLYTMPDRPFFCVEPWMGFPKALNTASGARWLAPGRIEHGRLNVWTSHGAT
jgi:galactose mutarotase-like enzyme